MGARAALRACKPAACRRASFGTIPVAALLVLGGAGALEQALPSAGVGLLGLMLMLAVLSAVHHAEVVAHRTGEPLGTLVLALAFDLPEDHRKWLAEKWAKSSKASEVYAEWWQTTEDPKNLSGIAIK